MRVILLTESKWHDNHIPILVQAEKYFLSRESHAVLCKDKSVRVPVKGEKTRANEE